MEDTEDLGGKRASHFPDDGKARARRPRVEDESPNHDGGYEEEKQGDRRRRDAMQVSDEEEEDDDEEEEEEPEEVVRGLGPKSDVRKRKKINPAGRPAEAGILVKVYCENFMCHRKLSVNLCPNVNFINGMNGSGKSAILAALQICLGARASVTHRGTRLSDLIRIGHEGHAVVRVTLLNRGSDAFRPQDFGEYVTVERKIERSGSGGYRLLKGNPNQPDTLQLVSNKKEDLESMLDRFNIQIENPCALLDQENAKSFIGGSAHDKYKFFLRATELDRLNRHLINSKERLIEAEDELQNNAASLDDLKKTWKEAEQKVQDVEGLAKIEKDLKRAKVEVAWADVQSKREEIEKIERVLANRQEKHEGAQKALAQSEQEKEDAVKDVDLHEERMKTLQADKEEANNRVRAIKQRLAEAKGPLQQYENAIKSKIDEIKDNLKRKRAAQKRLDEEREKMASEAQGETETKLRELQKVEDDLREAEARQETLKQQLTALGEQKGRLDEEMARLNDDQRRLGEDLRNLDRQRRELSTSKDELAAYGSSMVSLMQAVRRNAQHFAEPPLGPLGAFVKIKDEHREWRNCVENAIGSTMTSFVVTSKADQDKMTKLIQEHRTGGTVIFVKKLPRIEIRPNPEIRVVADLIQVDNSLVYNALIDWAKIDRSCVFRNRQEVDSFLARSRSNQLPGGCNTVYFPEDRMLKISRTGGKAFSPVNRPTNQARRLGVDSREQAQELEQELKKLQLDKQKLQEEGRRLQHEAKRVEQEGGALKKEFVKLRTTVTQLKSRKGDLTQEFEETRAATTNQVDLSDLEREVEGYDARVKEAQDKQRDIEQERDRIKADLEPLLKEEKAELNRAEKIKQDLSRMEKAADNLLQKLEQVEDRMKKSKRELEEYAKQVQKCEDAIKEKTANLTGVLEGARAYTRDEMPEWDGEDITTRKSPEQLDKEIQKHTRRLKREREQHNVTESLDVLKEKCMRAKRAYKDKGHALQRIQSNIDRMREGQKKRVRKAISLRKHITYQSTDQFDNVLQIKGQSGALVFDHKEQTLELTVQKDNRDESTQSRNVKELSGGERSYSTLALLISLGEAIECPFRAMDEFDIFMDSVSRRIALDVLLTTAKKHLHRQYIFVTPQNLDAVQESDIVKIWKLKPPERGGPGMQQTTL